MCGKPLDRKRDGRVSELTQWLEQVAANSPHVRLYDLESSNCDLLVGHSDIVLSVDVSPDGRWILTGSKDRTIRVWSASRLLSADDHQAESKLVIPSLPVAVVAAHTEAIGAVCFSASVAPFNAILAGSSARSHAQDHVISSHCAFAVSTSRDRTLKVWNLSMLAEWEREMRHLVNEKGDAVSSRLAVEKMINLPTLGAIVAHDKDINAVAVSVNDKLIATGSQDRTVKIWNVDLSKKAIEPVSLAGVMRGHRRGVWSVKFSPVDRVVCSGSSDQTIRIWSLADFTCLKTLQGHTNSVLKCLFFRAGTAIVSSGSDSVIKFWSVRSETCVATVGDQAHAEKIWALSAFPDQQRVVSGGVDSVINVWRDVSKEKIGLAAEKRDEYVAKEQRLRNALNKHDLLVVRAGLGRMVYRLLLSLSICFVI